MLKTTNLARPVSGQHVRINPDDITNKSGSPQFTHYKAGVESPSQTPGRDDTKQMAQTARDHPSQSIFPKAGQSSDKQYLGVSQSQSTLRPTTASTNSQVLSSMQRKGHQGTSIGVGSVQSSNRPMSATERAEQLRKKADRANNVSRARKMEAQAAEENKKRQTVPQAPNFASDNRASRRFLAKVAATPEKPQRKMLVGKNGVMPSLHTLTRARTRADIFGKTKLGDTHTLEDPYQPGMKYIPIEHLPTKGQASHNGNFSNCYKQRRTLFKVFEPSIGTMKGGNDVRDYTFKPTLYERPKTAKEREREREQAEDEADCSDNTVVRAYKKQQAHVEKLYWHEGSGGYSAARECACVYGEERHYKRPKKIRFYSARRTAKSREIWARLTRPKSAVPVVRKRDL